MKEYQNIFRYSRTALIIFSLSVLLGIGSILAASHFNTQAKLALAQQQSALQNTRAEIQTLTGDIEAIEKHLTGFKHLSNLGLIGNPNREIWVERLEATHRQSGLPPTLRYSLNPPKPHSADSSTPDALDHDLQIELSDIHEGEFLTFTDKLATDWMAPYRIENCSFQRSDEQGLKVDCTIRLFSIPLPPGADANPN
jgi:hypothetical protein